MRSALERVSGGSRRSGKSRRVRVRCRYQVTVRVIAVLDVGWSLSQGDYPWSRARRVMLGVFNHHVPAAAASRGITSRGFV